MGGKNQTTTQSSTQKYTPEGIDELRAIWDKVSSAASTPYEAYSGDMVAGLNPTQQTGIQNVSNAYGAATPYFNEAANYARTGAAQINPADIARYQNPYQQQVIDATRANFAEDNGRQQQQVIGNAAMKGALGGDRVGVAQAELARQQRLAQDPVIANLYSSGFDKSLGAAQGDRAAASQGAFTMGSLAPSIQNAQIQGGQAQIGAGTVAQQNDQQKLSALYQQYLTQQAYPYQQAQFLSSAGLPAVTAMGGTQEGTSTTTKPGPSPIGQIAGLGMAGLGLMSGNPFAFLSGMGSATGGGASSHTDGPMNRGGRVGMNRGGRARRSHFDHGGFVHTVNAIRQSLRRGGPVIETSRDANGIYVPQGYAEGGPVGFEDRWGGFPVSTGGAPFGSLPAAYNAISGVEDGSDPAVEAWRNGADLATPLAYAQGNAGGAPPSIVPRGAPQMAPMAAPPTVNPALAAAPSPLSTAPAQDDGTANNIVDFFKGKPLSEDARTGLLAAGLGMMASESPNALTQIGQGGLQGVKTYTGAKKERADNAISQRRVDLEAKRLAEQASQFARGHDLRERTLSEGIAERRDRAEQASQDRRDIARRTVYPGEGVDDQGNTVKGLYQFNTDTGEYDFKPGKVLQKGAGAGGARTPAVLQVADALIAAREEARKNKPDLPPIDREEAIRSAQRAPRDKEDVNARERLAQSLARNDPRYTIDKAREYYGLPPKAPTAEKKEEPGFFGRLFGGSEKPALKKMDPATLEAARASIKGGAPKADVEKLIREKGFDPAGL